MVVSQLFLLFKNSYNPIISTKFKDIFYFFFHQTLQLSSDGTTFCHTILCLFTELMNVHSQHKKSCWPVRLMMVISVLDIYSDICRNNLSRRKKMFKNRAEYWLALIFFFYANLVPTIPSRTVASAQPIFITQVKPTQVSPRLEHLQNGVQLYFPRTNVGYYFQVSLRG